MLGRCEGYPSITQNWNDMLIQGSQKLLAEKAVLILLEAARTILENQAHVVIALPGGTSVVEIYKNLGNAAFAWNRVHFFLLDERLVPADHPESNFRLVEEHLSGTVPPAMIHRFSYDPDNPDQGIIDYNSALKACGSRFDIVLASSGEDGHIASLFPNHPQLRKNVDGFLLVSDAPKPPPGRMSAGCRLIRGADSGILLFFGDGKAAALRDFMNDKLSDNDCPAKLMAELPNFYLLTDQEIESV